MSELARTDRWGRMRRNAPCLGAVVAASLVVACASIIGIDERLADDLVDGSAFDGPVTDDRSIGPTGCAETATCVDVPEGWQLASLDPERRGCTDGYDTPEELVVATAGLGCTCTCTETSPGSCVAPGATTTFRNYPAAGCSGSISTLTLTILDGGCVDAAITPSPYVRIPTAPSGPPVCAADASPSRFDKGQACAARGTACNDGGVCSGALPAGARQCVRKTGDVDCPAGYDEKLPVGTSTGADTRKCGSCSCTPEGACNSPKLELFTGGACSNASLAVPASGSCTATDAGIQYASYRYSGRAPGCQPSIPPLLDGGVTIEGRSTMCCKPLD